MVIILLLAQTLGGTLTFAQSPSPASEPQAVAPAGATSAGKPAKAAGTAKVALGRGHAASPEPTVSPIPWTTQLVTPEPVTDSTIGRSLDDSYLAALRRSELVGIQEEAIVQAQENYTQAIGSILPTLAGVAAYETQDASNPAPGSFGNPNQPLVKMTLTQNLFQGLREYAALRQTVDLTHVAQGTRDQASLTLYQSTATAYFTLLSLEHDYRNVQTELSFYQRWIKELEDRIRIGRSRITEVLLVQATYKSLQAAGDALLTQIAAQREVYAFVTGFDRKTLLLESQDLPAPVKPVETYTTLVDQRPDVHSQVDNVTSNEEGVLIAKEAHLPSVVLTGDLYGYRVSPVSQDNDRWDLTATLTLPIYSGGVLQSKVRQAVSLKNQAELNLSQTRRQAIQSIVSSHGALRYDQQGLASLIEAADVAKKNYYAQESDYKLGLVTNIDVLTALTNFQETLRSLDRIRYTVQLDYAQLESAVNNRPKIKSLVNP